MSSKKIRFDNWIEEYSTRTEGMRSSEIRDLLKVTARPDIISLAGGLPYTKGFKMDNLIEATKDVMQESGADALQYGPSEGIDSLKEHIIEIMNEEGIKVHYEDILITDGAQQALDLLGKIFINPGDSILVEAPSYVGAINAFNSYQANFIPVTLEKDGLDVKELEVILKKNKGQNRPKFLYLIPNFHNPAGVTLSKKKRKRIIQLAKDYQLSIIEDNPYGKLRFEGKSIPSLRYMDDSIIYLSTFSKIFSPGFRVGWVVAPYPILEKLIFAKQAADLCSSSFTQKVINQYFNSFNWREYIEELVGVYRERRDTMLHALREFFPDEASWTEPHGGFFIWSTLPSYIDTTEMLAQAITEKVAYVPGRGFFTDGSGKNCMRLNFSYPSKDEIYMGIKRLSVVIKDYIKLYQSVMKNFQS